MFAFMLQNHLSKWADVRVGFASMHVQVEYCFDLLVMCGVMSATPGHDRMPQSEMDAYMSIHNRVANSGNFKYGESLRLAKHLYEGFVAQ